MNYQVEIAILEALDLMSLLLVEPLVDAELSMEPRILSSSERATCWDIGRSHPKVISEVKLEPNHGDVVGWLTRIGVTADKSVDEFRLYFGRGGVPLLQRVDALSRIAHEAGSSEQRFRDLVRFEAIDDVDKVLDALGPDAHLTLQRIVTVPVDRGRLDRDIQRGLRYLAHAPQRQQLNDFLFRKLHKGIEGRVTLRVRDLISEAQSQEIHLLQPPSFGPAQLPPPVAAAVFLLQLCEHGLPVSVVAAGAGLGQEDMNAVTAPYLDQGVLAVEDGLLTIYPFKSRIALPGGADLAGDSLPHLLEFIRANKNTQVGRLQVPNVIALAKACRPRHREEVACLFGSLQGLLKRMGNKRLVLEVAELSLAAARIPERTERQAKAEVLALICGRSWVYQRTGRLREARAHGEMSLEKGKAIGWARNTGFCLKCLGRLFRMEAEEAGREGRNAEADVLLERSEDYLNQAIACFTTNAAEIGSDAEREVGDCQSLLARTFLESKQLPRAREAARIASSLITDELSKDYADLQIVLGDLALAATDRDAAVAYYDTVIGMAVAADAEKSEITARAWFRKGVATNSRSCLEQAAEIWQRLCDSDNVAQAHWHCILIDDRLPARTIRQLARERLAVRVEAVRLHEDRLATAGPSRGRRSDPGDAYWESLVKTANRNVTVRQADW